VGLPSFKNADGKGWRGEGKTVLIPWKYGWLDERKNKEMKKGKL
jgi:hypothetical protein